MSSTKDNSLDFIRYVIANLVENQDDIIVEKSIDELGILITLKLNKEDMGRIIGKNGQTIKSIRTLLRIIAKKENQKINLKIIEPTE